MDKREKITQAAIEVFSSKGIEKTTVSEIVKKAGIAQGTFYLYFPSKLAVMPAIAEVMVNKMLEGLTSEVKGGPIREKLEGIIHVIFTITNEYKELTKLIYTGLTQTQYVGNWEEIYAPLYNWVEELLQREQEAQAIHSDVNVKYSAKILIGAIESVAEQIYLYDQLDAESIEEQKKELHRFVTNALGAYQ